VRAAIEAKCIQDLMLRSVLANRAAPSKLDVFKPCLHLLEKFHSAKNDHSCQTAICRLWQPILWRHLVAANAMVRRSSAEMLFAAFPVENPDAHIEEKASRHEAQYKILLELLSDSDVEVRVTSIQGVCGVIAVFWSILPTTFLSQAVRYLIKDLAFDASSPKVRIAVLKGNTFEYLLEFVFLQRLYPFFLGLKLMLNNCERSHLYLKKILPKIKDIIHDINEGVRLSFVDLLGVIKRVRSINYWEVVSLDELLLRLEADTKPAVATKIAALLYNSFFPTSDDPKDEAKIERAVFMIKKNRGASRRFYEHCQSHLGLHQCVKFILAILAKLRTFVKDQMSREDGDISSR